MGRGAIVLPEATWWPIRPEALPGGPGPLDSLFLCLYIALLIKLAPVVDLWAVSSARITPNITAPIANSWVPRREKNRIGE
jgi:hypothetical protein